MTEMIREPVVLNDPPLDERSDLDSLFWMSEEGIAMQQTLGIETFEEARDKGGFVPKPRQWDVHPSLRKIRRLTLKAHEYGLLNSTDLEKLIRYLINFLRSGDEETLRGELKKLVYVLMLDKKYAETIDGTTSELLATSFEKSLDRLPMSWTSYLKKAEPEDIYLAFEEVFRDLHPHDEDGFIIRNPEREAETKYKYPHLFKLMFGEHYMIFASKKDEEEFDRNRNVGK
jgi:hypothetical protein